MKLPKKGVYPIFDLRYERIVDFIKKQGWRVENPSITKTGRAIGVWRQYYNCNDEWSRDLKLLMDQLKNEFGNAAPIVKSIKVSCYGRGQEWTEQRERLYIDVQEAELLSGKEILNNYMANK